VARGARGVLPLDRAGWHTASHPVVPRNPTPIFLLSRAPELNPVENVWQYRRANWLSTRVFETDEAIIEAPCEAWRNLLAQPRTIPSIGLRRGPKSVDHKGRRYKISHGIPWLSIRRHAPGARRRRSKPACSATLPLVHVLARDLTREHDEAPPQIRTVFLTSARLRSIDLLLRRPSTVGHHRRRHHRSRLARGLPSRTLLRRGALCGRKHRSATDTALCAKRLISSAFRS
jgi:hypothetical protein